MHYQRSVTLDGKTGIQERERALRIIRNCKIIHPVIIYLLKCII